MVLCTIFAATVIKLSEPTQIYSSNHEQKRELQTNLLEREEKKTECAAVQIAKPEESKRNTSGTKSDEKLEYELPTRVLSESIEYAPQHRLRLTQSSHNLLS
jgi:hypothetical protein